MLLTLIKLGLVTETQRHYRLTPRVLRLGYSFLSQTGLDGLVQPFVTEVGTWRDVKVGRANST
jgi:IclR family transcriptional regulator, pca regulon regulatory protein